MIGHRLSVSIAHKHVLEASLRHGFGETIGDIPMYSLHRIRKQMARTPPTVSYPLQRLLIEKLLEANAEYKADSGNDWNCLTSNNLVSAIENTNSSLEATVEGIGSIPKELAQHRAKLQEKLHEARVRDVLLIQKWFETHFENLQYDMRGSVPWTVVQRLRRDLGFWIATKGNRFGSDIEETIIEIAEEVGIHTDSAESAWELMGGKVFTGRRERD